MEGFNLLYMKRLIRKNKLNKKASLFSNFDGTLDSFSLPSGDTISINYRMINNNTLPMFQVCQEGLYNVASFYDGSDYDKAERIYKDLLMAFNGIKQVEKFNKFRIKEDFENFKDNNIIENDYKTKIKQMLYGMDGTEEF